jgi:type IV pilus assembly protein PilW
MRATPPPRGLTLLEVLVAAAASAIVLVAVVATVRAQQNTFNAGQRVRETQSSARTALLLIEPKLALAGYGMDPVLAFDLTGQAGDPDPMWHVGPCPVAAAPCRKDRTDGSDELVFHYRDPDYWADPSSGEVRGNAWQVTAFNPAGGTITVAARAGDLFLQGQVLQGVCDQGAGARYFTVRVSRGETQGPAAQPVAADKDIAIPLQGDVWRNPFRRQNGGTCTPSRLFLVERRRYHVRPVQTGGRWESYLVLDRGIDLSRDGVIDENDELIVAEGVELLQVAYEFTSNVDVASGTNSTLAPVGLAPGIPVAVRPATADRVGAPNLAANTITRPAFASIVYTDAQFYDRESYYAYRFGPPLALERTTNHVANVSAVHLAVVARSTASAPAQARGEHVPGFTTTSRVFNLDRTPAWIAAGADADGRDGNERVRVESTVLLPNMVSRRLLYQ